MRRERRLGTGFAPFAFNAGDKRGFLAADERARAKANVYIKIETAA